MRAIAPWIIVLVLSSWAIAIDVDVSGTVDLGDKGSGTWGGRLTIKDTDIQGTVNVNTPLVSSALKVQGQRFADDAYLGTIADDGKTVTMRVKLSETGLEGVVSMAGVSGSLAGHWNYGSGRSLTPVDMPAIAEAEESSESTDMESAQIDPCASLETAAQGRSLISGGLRSLLKRQCNRQDVSPSGVSTLGWLIDRVRSLFPGVSSSVAANLFVNSTSGDFYYQSEVSIAASGNLTDDHNHVVAVFNDKQSGTGFATSADKGATWTDRGSLDGTTDPVVVSDTAGAFHATYIKGSGTTFNVYYRRSTDNGATFPTSSEQVLSGGPMADKPWVAVDNSPSSPCAGTVYVCFANVISETGNDNKIKVTRSTDGGSSFHDPIAVTNSGFLNLCALSTGKDGKVYVAWFTFDALQIRLRRSDDCGVTWTPSLSNTPRVVGDAIPMPEDPACNNDWTLPGHVHEAPTPILVTDQLVAGNVYAVWESWKGYTTKTTARFARSTDFGVTWSTYEFDAAGYEFQPFITTAVFPGSPPTSVLFAHWYRFTSLSPPSYDVFSDVSTDSGLTWQSAPTKVTSASSAVPDPLADCYMGDYIGSAAVGGSTPFVPAWTDCRRYVCKSPGAYDGQDCAWSTSAGQYLCPNGSTNCQRDMNVMVNSGGC